MHTPADPFRLVMLPQTPTPQAVEPPADPAPSIEPSRVLLHMPIDVRSVSLAVLAVLGSVFMLHWAAAVFIPLLLGIIVSYALSPIVNKLERWRLPRALGAGLLLSAIVAGAGWTGYALSDQATRFIEGLPDAAQKLRLALRTKPHQPGTIIDKVQEAAAELEKAARESGSAQAPAAERGVTRVQIAKPTFNIKDYVWSSTPSVLASIGQLTVVLFIAFFLLAAGSTFRRKLVKIAGPTLTQKKITVQALDEITEQVQRYLLAQVLVSVIVGVVTWLAYLWIGVDNAAVWGVLAFAMNFVPYIGALFVTAGSALAAFVQFGSVDMGLLVAGVSLGVHTILGNVLTPWLLSRASRMNPVAVFVGVLAFGWLWGLWGLLLGVPILTMLKTVCDRVEDLKPLGELLGA